MNGTRPNGWIITLAVLALFVGCTSQSKLIPLKPLDVDLQPYTSMVLTIDPMVTEDVKVEMAQLDSLIVLKVEELGLFEHVGSGEAKDVPEGTLHVKVTITDIKKVSEGKRLWLGSFAGRATMTTEISFIDPASGQTLGSYSVTGESGGTGISGGTSDAVKKTDEAIADVISKNYGGASGQAN